MFLRFYSRAYQFLLKSMAPLFNWQPETVLNCAGCIEKLAPKLADDNIDRVLIVTDEKILNAGLLNSLLTSLNKANIIYYIYKGVEENPTVSHAKAARDLYLRENCQAIIGFGGGSAIDCAKGAGVLSTNNMEHLSEYKGFMKVKNKLPYLVAVPTTAGTGSEASNCAVLSDETGENKFVITDAKLMPKTVVLDPELLISLSREMTAYTGMDALVHAVEAYISQNSNKQTRMLSEEAVELIFKNLYESYQDGSNITARTNMQRASYFSGKAFTRAGLGNIHALSHSIELKYKIHHGHAVAYLMPYVLEKYGSKINSQLAKLALIAGVSEESDSIEESAQKFIHGIRLLNEKMNIEMPLNALAKEEVGFLAKLAYKEANPYYPVPVMFNKDDFQGLLERVFISERRIA